MLGAVLCADISLKDKDNILYNTARQVILKNKQLNMFSENKDCQQDRAVLLANTPYLVWVIILSPQTILHHQFLTVSV